MQTNDQKKSKNIPDPVQHRTSTVPNENTGLNIDEHVKIFDPNNQEILLEKRA